MKIRSASREDVNSLAEMCMRVQALHVALQPSLFQEPTLERLAEFFGERLKDPDFVIFIAWEEYSPIGYVMLHVVRKPAHVLIRERQSVEIDHIHVEKRYQGRGVGRRLAARAVELANALKIETIELSVWAENHPAVTAFEAIGFTQQRHVMVLGNKEKFEQDRGSNP